jgi:hypothetical protein
MSDVRNELLHPRRLSAWPATWSRRETGDFLLSSRRGRAPNKRSEEGRIGVSEASSLNSP